MMGMTDISFLDIDELGVRPKGWNDEGASGMDFDSTTGDFFGQDKLSDFPLIKIDLCQSGNGSEDDEESDYDIDPETGEKIFRETVIASSQSLLTSSPSNFHWVEEYLSNLSSTPVTIPKRTVIEYPLHAFSSPDSEFDWKRTDPSLYHPNLSMEEKNSILQSSTQTFYMPMTTDNHSSYNISSVSTDDEHSTSSGSQGRRYYSSIESGSPNLDGEINFDGHFHEPKLEKIERDEHSISPLFVRRSSVRPNTQGQQDEEILRRSNIPLNVTDITQSSTEEYNRHLARLNYLTTEQIHIIKDIRRRGKNKIAAQNCRKRKANSVEFLLEEVDELKRMKNDLEDRKRLYQQQIDETRHQYEYLHHQVLPNRQLPPAIFVK